MRFLHLRNIDDLLRTLPSRSPAVDDPRLSIRKIFHCLFKRRFCETVLEIEYSDHPSLFSQVEAESRMYRSDIHKDAKVYHFFSAAFDSIDKLPAEPSAYHGYCLVRSDWSVSYAFISSEVVIHERDHSYAFLVCKLNKSIEIIPGDSRTIAGFPYCGKDGGAVMCAQASLGTIAEYCNSTSTGIKFSIASPAEINQKANVPAADLALGKNRGLSIQEMRNFFAAEGVNHHFAYMLTYTPAMVRQERPEVNIYGFLESGWPVCCLIKAGGELHALSVIGHTFDRNNWEALADLLYYRRPLTGGGRYHSNLAWIRHFIVQDDNFGPYFFLPWTLLADILVAFVVPVPDSVFEKLSPIEIEREAYLAIAKICKSHYGNLCQQKVLLAGNEDWAQHFMFHATRGDFVLRPLFMTKAKVNSLFDEHEYSSRVASLLAKTSSEWLGVVEISWPNIYCYQEAMAGLVVFDPADLKDPILVCLPGALYSSRLTSKIVLAKAPDPPRQHMRPGRC